jgi:hypothetical protein
MIALAATLHDQTGALAADVRRHLGALRGLYPGGVLVATSPPTAASTTRLLAASGAHAGTPARNERGPLYRRCIEAALATGAARVHYLDFDRALHWVATQPGELAHVLRLGERHDVLVVGRTERAHRSHHRPLYATETIANRLITDRLGWSGRVDGLVPSFVLARAEATRLVRGSRARGDAIYGEWLALVATSAREIAYVECRGLEWETPDRDRAAVAGVGLDVWRAGWDTPEEWTRRSRMAERIVRAFEHGLARRSPGPRPELRRVVVRP